VELGLQLPEDAGAPRQVVERGIGRVAAVAVGLGPRPTRRVLIGQHAARRFQFGVEIFEFPVCAKGRFVNRSRKEVTHRHGRALTVSGMKVKAWASGASSKRPLEKQKIRYASGRGASWGAKE